MVTWASPARPTPPHSATTREPHGRPQGGSPFIGRSRRSGLLGFVVLGTESPSLGGKPEEPSNYKTHDAQRQELVSAQLSLHLLQGAD